MLFLLKIYCRWYQCLPRFSIDILGRYVGFLYPRYDKVMTIAR
jgi:hypothetical protein